MKYYRVTFANYNGMSVTCVVKAKNEREAVESARTNWTQNARVVEVEEDTCSTTTHLEIKSMKTKFYLLEPQPGKINNKYPIDGPDVSCFGFVVEATNEKSARQLAASAVEDEGWLMLEYSTCVELTPTGQEQIILAS